MRSAYFRLIWPFVRLGALLFGRFVPEEGDAVRAVGRARVPILIVHGEDDRFVPCAMSEAIRDANPTLVRRHTFPGAGHGLSYVRDTARYEALLGGLIAEVLPEAVPIDKPLPKG